MTTQAPLEREAVLRRILEREELYRSVFNQQFQFVAILSPDGTVLEINDLPLRVQGGTREEYVGKLFWETPAWRHIPDWQQTIEERIQRALRSDSPVLEEDVFQTADGSLRYANASYTAIRDDRGELRFVLVEARDVTERKRAQARLEQSNERLREALEAARELEEKLRYLASHDGLTGLINRYEFERRAERLLADVAEGAVEHALCYIDLDQFKLVNDTCGHTAGDAMLRALSPLMQESVSERDTLARLGGDEFAVLIERTTLASAAQVARGLLRNIQRYRFEWGGHVFRVGASIGLIPVTTATPSVTEMLRHADSACYVAKERGRNRVYVSQPDDEALSRRRVEMSGVSGIHAALDEDRFLLYAQGIQSLARQEVRHYELLVRMRGRGGDVLPPSRFIPAAERYGVIGQIDRWVVTRALEVLRENAGFLEAIDFVSVNVSGHSLADPSFLDFVVERLAAGPVSPRAVCLEITETATISNLPVARQFIERIKQLGCRFALDDFGSGVSSFGYLRTLPVDYLKIDGAFVRRVASDPVDRAMVRSINEIGHLMGMKTIAEFVEDAGIMAVMRELGVDYAQGHIVARPEPLAAVIRRTAGGRDA